MVEKATDDRTNRLLCTTELSCNESTVAFSARNGDKKPGKKVLRKLQFWLGFGWTETLLRTISVRTQKGSIAKSTNHNHKPTQTTTTPRLTAQPSRNSSSPRLSSATPRIAPQLPTVDSCTKENISVSARIAAKQQVCKPGFSLDEQVDWLIAPTNTTHFVATGTQAYIVRYLAVLSLGARRQRRAKDSPGTILRWTAKGYQTVTLVHCRILWLTQPDINIQGRQSISSLFDIRDKPHNIHIQRRILLQHLRQYTRSDKIFMLSWQQQSSARGTQRGTLPAIQRQVIISAEDLPRTTCYVGLSTQKAIFAYCRFGWIS